MKFFSKLFPKSPAFTAFAEIEKRVGALQERIRCVERLDEKTTRDVAAAQSAFDSTPTVNTLEVLNNAILARSAFVSNNLYGRIAYSIRDATTAIQKSPESLATYRACLSAILDGLGNELERTRSKLQSAFAEAGDVGVSVDGTPAIQRLNFAIGEVTKALSVLDRGALTDMDAQSIMGLIRELPAPPAPPPVIEGMITSANRLLKQNGGLPPPAEPETYPPGFFGPVTLLSSDDRRKTEAELCHPPQ
jgi:hypothetical protein